MKKLLAILLALLLLCGCNTEESKEPELPTEDLPQQEISESTQQPETEEKKSPLKTVFEYDGKFGIKNADGEVVFEAVYDKIEAEESFFIVYKKTGTREVPKSDNYGNDVYMAEVDAYDVDIVFPDGSFYEEGPFDSVYVWDNVNIGFAKDGTVYGAEYSGTEITITGEKKPETFSTDFGYEIFSYWYRAGDNSGTGFKGAKNSAGEVIIPCMYRFLDILFSDRAYCTEGISATQGPLCGRVLVINPETGEEINSSYNFMKIFTFDKGYLGIAFVESEDNTEFPVYLPDGTPTPYGWRFVDRDGKETTGVLYERIYTEDVDWIWYNAEITDPDTKIYAQRFDGTVEEFTVRDLLMK